MGQDNPATFEQIRQWVAHEANDSKPKILAEAQILADRAKWIEALSTKLTNNLSIVEPMQTDFRDVFIEKVRGLLGPATQMMGLIRQNEEHVRALAAAIDSAQTAVTEIAGRRDTDIQNINQNKTIKEDPQKLAAELARVEQRPGHHPGTNCRECRFLPASCNYEPLARRLYGITERIGAGGLTCMCLTVSSTRRCPWAPAS